MASADPAVVARLIACLASTVEDGAINVNVVVEPPAGANQTAAASTVTANGSTTDDIYGSVTFYAPTTNSTNPTVLGVTLTPGQTLTISADPGRGLDSIAYTAAATAALVILTVTK
jgi:hypothetical protein